MIKTKYGNVFRDSLQKSKVATKKLDQREKWIFVSEKATMEIDKLYIRIRLNLE